MFNKLLERFTSANKKDAVEIATPDISRVIKLSDVAPQTAATVTNTTTESMGARAEQAVDSLSDQFEDWMRGDLDRLLKAWQGAQADGATPERYREVFTAAHDIRGAATSYGYPAISRLCGSLCTLLSSTHPGENTALINLHVEACRAAFKTAREPEGAQSVADAVCDALERKVARKTGSA